MKLEDGNGRTIMQVKVLKRDGNRLIFRGMAMGGTPMTVYVRPDELWSIFYLLSWNVIKYLPVILWTGFRMSSKIKDK